MNINKHIIDCIYGDSSLCTLFSSLMALFCPECFTPLLECMESLPCVNSLMSLQPLLLETCCIAYMHTDSPHFGFFHMFLSNFVNGMLSQIAYLHSFFPL